MKNLILSSLLRLSGILFTTTAVTLTALNIAIASTTTPSNSAVKSTARTNKQIENPKAETNQPKEPNTDTSQPTTPSPSTLLLLPPGRSSPSAIISSPSSNTVWGKKIQELKKSNKPWIQIQLSKQRLIAWEGQKLVYAVVISTGKKATPTPPGVFTIQSKQRIARMRGADYDVPDVPYTMYYYGGYAIHGAYWHKRFGTPVSHGCTNVAVNHAKWLFNWANVGTTVVVHP